MSHLNETSVLFFKTLIKNLDDVDNVGKEKKKRLCGPLI